MYNCVNERGIAISRDQDERYYILQERVSLQTYLDSLNPNVSDNYNKEKSMNELQNQSLIR
ncbi:hypothetical protein DN401_14680 [Bacillus sp. BF2-3]|nr:hypothetical protein DN401_14680 [Bacillus sp. BF2-3]